jgi:hypothetical protein
MQSITDCSSRHLNLEGRQRADLDLSPIILRAAEAEQRRLGGPINPATRNKARDTTRRTHTQMIAVHPHDVKGYSSGQKEMAGPKQYNNYCKENK